MFIDFRNEGNKIVLRLRLLIFQLKLIQILQVYILSAHVKREKSAILSHLVQSGVLPRRRNRKFSSALSTSDSQIVHAFPGKQASTSCLSCDSALLRLQFPPFRDAEAELGNESWVDSSIIVDGKNHKL